MVKVGYFNCLLFPLAVAKRALDKVTGSESADDEIPKPWLNKLLFNVFRLEQFWIGKAPMPWGLSAFAVLEKCK